ncbi:MAG: hypothetical protein KGN16_08260 [Burkholderiales bacterium]|nr:hypothetical protein [Burkholderiales bacterium]
MPYQLIWEHRGVVKEFRGDVDGREVIASVVEVEADPRFDALRFVINDFTAVQALSLAMPDVDHISAIDWAAARINARIRIAIVTADATLAELAEEYANSPMNAYPTRIFPTLGEARAWLAQPT